jgi:hypothetical protein
VAAWRVGAVGVEAWGFGSWRVSLRGLAGAFLGEQAVDVFGGFGAAVEVALVAPAVELFQGEALLFGFDAFGDDFEAEAGGKGEDGGDDGPWIRGFRSCRRRRSGRS